MKKIYICSPFAGDVSKNIRNAKIYSRWVYKQGYLPICVHIYLEEATGLNEKKGDRDKLIELGKEILRMCDEVWVFGNKVSNGMIRELAEAVKYKIKIKNIKWEDEKKEETNM